MQKVTIDDVAKAAGVSRQTVSRAINNKGEITPETKERVLAVVEKLGYRPNRLAQGMVTQRTMTIGLVVPDITNLFFPEVARGVQDAGREHGYNIPMTNRMKNSPLSILWWTIRLMALSWSVAAVMRKSWPSSPMGTRPSCS